MADEKDWGFYIIPDLRTWAFPKEYAEQSKIEHYGTFEEAKKRFDELRNEPYNSENALAENGQPSPRLGFGIEKGAAAFDILHVRGGENVLVTDFTRDENFSQENSLLAIIRKTATEIGFDKVNHYPLLENGRYGNATLVPFDKWTAQNPQFNLAAKKEPLPLYKESLAYAKDNGEISKWRESFDETRRCAGALQKLIAENHADMSLKTKPVIESAVAEFGAERVSLVLASTIQMRTGDGRISPANREWANGIEVPQDGYTNRILVNSHSCLIDGVVDDYKQFLLDIEKNLAKKQEISDTHLNGGTTMEHETTFEVSSMLKIDDGSAVKALANVVINGEIAINNLKVMESAAGNLNVVMPSKMGAKGYEDVAFPITSEARAMLQNAVMSNFEKLVASGEQKLKNDLQTDKTKPAVSDLKVTLSEVKHATVKAAGEVKIDDCFVIKDVKVMQPKDPTKPLFVSMPSYPNSRGGYTEFALPITTAMHAKLNEEVAVKAYRSMEQVAYKGVKYAELGDKSKGEIAATNKLNIGFAEKLMSELDKAGVTYQARVGSKSGTVISVNIADKPRLDEVQKNLTAALNAPKQDVPKQDAPKPHHARH